MKKLLALLLVVVMLAQIVPMVFAQETAEVTLTSASAECGETVTITVAVSNCVAAKAIYIAPLYDEETLEIVSGKWLISGALTADWSEKTGDAVITFTDNTDINTDIFAFVFKVKDGAQAGKVANVSCEIIINTVDGENEVPVPLTVTGGAVTVNCPHTSKTKVPAKSPDCVNSGNHLYYICDACGLVFQTDGVTETTVEAEAIPALGHDYENADCETPKTCKRCGATEGEALGHDWTAKVEDDAHLREQGKDCQSYNTYWYGCSRCGAISDSEYFTGTVAGTHAFTEKIEDAAHLVPGSGADCQSVKQYYYDCAYCDAIGTGIWDSTTYGEHKMATAWTSENGRHFHKCTLCDYTADEAPCSGGTASCTEKAVCAVCNMPYGELAEHDYAAEWNPGDASGHWHVCKNCGGHDEPVAHTPNIPAATEDEAKVCTQCGYVLEAKLTHTHKTTKVAGYDATCTQPGQKTYYTCTCGKWFEDATANVEITDRDSVVIPALGHNYAEATCTAPKTCKRCGATEGEALGHDYAEATCITPKTCKRCGATEGEALGHDYAEATCTTPKTCKRCGATEGEALGHDYTEATCTAPKTCKRCGVTEGEALGHDYAAEWNPGDASGHWHVCKNCGGHDEPVAHTPNIPAATEDEAKVCTQCGYVMEAKLSHTHKPTEVAGYDATCTQPGQKTYYTCTCGKWFEDATANVEITDRDSVVIPALGHDYAEATCTTSKTCKRCGVTEGEALGHTVSDWQQDGENHWKYCTVCGVELEKAAHSDGDGNGSCDACGYPMVTETPDIPATGDTTGILLLAVLLLSSGACLTAMIKRRKV